MNWVDAAKGKTAASCPFEYAAKLTEVMLLGVVALQGRHGRSSTTARTCASPTCRPRTSTLERAPRAGWSSLVGRPRSDG